MDKEDSNDDKVLKALKSVCKKTKGPQKEVLEYQISQMNQRKILQKNLNIFQSRVSKERLNAKIGREQNYKAGLEKLLLIDESNLSELQKKRDFSEKKLYFLERAKKKAFDQNEDTRYVKTTGNLKLTITDVQINPVFKCSRIDFIVDMNIKKSLKPAFRGDVNISLINSKEFEIIVIGEEDSIISLIFFPCEYLVSHTQSKEEFLDIEEGFIKLKVSFEKEAKLVRRNAERSCVILFGHTLESYRCIYLLYCCVCSQSINYFTPAFRCLKCKFTCHKICANYIFFKCPCVEHEKESITKRYDIPHKLVNKTSSGVIWCSHCGERIDFNTSCSQCTACGIKLHEVCSKRVFNACGITYELRCAIADFNPPVNDNLRLKSSANIDDFTFLKVLGRGSFGKVMLAKHLHNNQIVALKILKKESLVDSNEITCIELERRVLDFATKSNHPFLMKMHFCFQDSMHLFFGTEFLPGGDLFHHAAKNDFSNSQIKLYAAEILMGIEFLHRSNIIYRDMKLDNILLAADGHVKIADFGLCRDKFGPYTVAYTYCGTPDTIAPEVILNGGYTKDTDWWSYGVVLYEMFEGEPPFNGATALEMSAGIIHDEVQFKKTPEVAQDLISKLLTKDPSQRLGHGMEDGEEIRSHPYFSKIDWNDVLERKYKPVFIPGDSINANFDEEFIEEPIHLTPCNSVVQYDKYFTNFK